MLNLTENELKLVREYQNDKQRKWRKSNPERVRAIKARYLKKLANKLAAK